MAHSPEPKFTCSRNIPHSAHATKISRGPISIAPSAPLQIEKTLGLTCPASTCIYWPAPWTGRSSTPSALSAPWRNTRSSATKVRHAYYHRNPPLSAWAPESNGFFTTGTAIAPFLPVPTPPASALWTPVHILLFVLRAPAVFFLSVFYFGILEFLPVGALVKKCVLWVVLAVPGVWWVDLQVDGVKRGRLADNQDHLPHPGTIIASSFTSPLDPLYLAGIFCPVFTKSWPGEKKVEAITLFRAICLAFSKPQLEPPPTAKLVTLKELTERYPNSIICVFPECTTTNGRGILPFSPSLLTADTGTKIYPVNLRYTPGDITTPVPGNVFNWIWKLLSKPTHCMRVRIARHVYNVSSPNSSNPEASKTSGMDKGFDTNIFDSPHLRNGIAHDFGGGAKGGSAEEQKFLDRVGEDLARLGRVKRVGLGVQEKIEFVKIWSSRRR